MKRWVLSACAAGAMAVGAAQPAEAALVAYGTSGSFSCAGYTGGASCATTVDAEGTASIVTVGGTTLQFTRVPLSIKDVPPPTNVSFGSLTTVSSGGDDLSGLGFTLNFHQGFPTADNGSLTASASGRIQVLNSTAFVVFNPANLSVHLAPFLYTITSADQNNTQGTAALLTVADGPNAIEGQVSYVAEPASMMLFGTALFGLFGVGRRFSIQ